MSFSVIIPSARATNVCACVEALRACEPDLTLERIVVVDDGARADAEPRLGALTWIQGAKPFIFARNVNLGIRACQGDIILLNDDAELLTGHGFSAWAELMAGQPRLGICSAGIRGAVGNPRQQAASHGRLELERETLAFVCVYIPRGVIDALGPLDERFTGYGFEDNDYCERAVEAGLELGVWHGCVVSHDGRLPSTFRTRPDVHSLLAQSRRIHQAKRRESPGPSVQGAQESNVATSRFSEEKRTVKRESAVEANGGAASTAHAQAAASRLNIRWCGDPLPGYANACLGGLDSDDSVDLSGAWPWEDGSMSEVRAWNVLERLHDKIRTMNELWRILRDGGTAELVLPTTDGTGAFQDPTHASYWNRRSFLYYEEGSAYRERHAARYGIKARFRVETERSESTADGPRLFIRLCAVKGEIANSEHTREPERSVVASGTSSAEFVCAMRVKNEAEHIREAIESVLPLCQKVLLFDDHSTDATVDIARSFGERCIVLGSPFEGLDEARDKNYLLEQLTRLDPAWVLWTDGDEVLELGGPAALRTAAKVSGTAGYSLRIAYLWDDPMQVRVDGLYGNFRRPSLFRVQGQNASRLRFRATRAGGNLHCGNVPTGLKGGVGALPVRLKHYGYLTAEQRQQKYRFYTTMDPNNAYEDNYRHIAGIPGARHAPGPPVFVPWRE